MKFKKQRAIIKIHKGLYIFGGGVFCPNSSSSCVLFSMGEGKLLLVKNPTNLN